MHQNTSLTQIIPTNLTSNNKDYRNFKRKLIKIVTSDSEKQY